MPRYAGGRDITTTAHGSVVPFLRIYAPLRRGSRHAQATEHLGSAQLEDLCPATQGVETRTHSAPRSAPSAAEELCPATQGVKNRQDRPLDVKKLEEALWSVARFAEMRRTLCDCKDWIVHESATSTDI